MIDRTQKSSRGEEGWNLEASYRGLPSKLFSQVPPTPVKDPKMVLYNEALGKSLGLKFENPKGQESVQIFSGNQLPKGALPIAQAYAGHQFGYFTSLGDGRAVLLGEQITPTGERFDIQLKGSGPTPYSRRGDGRAALGPMLREYIISEAMIALGVPSTRALAVVISGEEIQRESSQPGGILTRVASSHLRVGTFEYVKQFGSEEDLKALADYAIQRHYPYIMKEEGNIYLRFFEAVADRQAALIAKWQLIGFIHGVMNTDNMSISGETIDYGPCAFMDTYDPDTVFSSIDQHGRYAYKNQAPIGQWNLARFAESLLPLIHREPKRGIALMEDRLQKYSTQYQKYWLQGMAEKIGIFQPAKEDEELIEDLLRIMKKNDKDFTNTFFELTYPEKGGGKEDVKKEEGREFSEWLDKWRKRLKEQKATEEEVQKLMKASNPVVIPRNHQVEKALQAAVEEGDYRVLESLLKILQTPYTYSEEKKSYQNPPDPSDEPYVTYCGT